MQQERLMEVKTKSGYRHFPTLLYATVIGCLMSLLQE
jgi:hypothetical protein